MKTKTPASCPVFATGLKNLRAKFLGLAAFLTIADVAHAQIVYSVTGSNYLQNFDGLPTIIINTFILAQVGKQSEITGATEWQGTKVGGNGAAATDFTANAGGTNTGGIYSYGTGTSTDRSLGALASDSDIMAFGATFLNTTGDILTSVSMSFTAEFWRSSTTTQNVLTFAYGLVDGTTVTNANFLTAAGSTAFATLNVTGPAPVVSNGALDGNLPANQAAVSGTITGLNIANNGTFFIRWTDVNDSGNDAGLAIDNFNLSAVPEPSTCLLLGVGLGFTLLRLRRRQVA
ncbi:MAG: PEP-CTERM sorting domain-containing protein [Terrimicrobiaceae bacterium]